MSARFAVRGGVASLVWVVALPVLETVSQLRKLGGPMSLLFPLVSP